MPQTASNFTVVNATSADITALNQSLSYLDKSSTGDSILGQAAGKNVTISIIHDGDDRYDPNTNTIYWDPNSALTVVDPSDNAGSIGVQSAALGLVHEAYHSIDPNLATEVTEPDPNYGNVAEKVAVQQEDIVATDLGEPNRYNHTGDFVVEANPTEHTVANNDGTISWEDVNSSGTTVVEGTFQPGTYPGTAPVGGGDGTGTETIDANDMTVTPDVGRAIDVTGQTDTVEAVDSVVTVGSNVSVNISLTGNVVSASTGDSIIGVNSNGTTEYTDTTTTTGGVLTNSYSGLGMDMNLAGGTVNEGTNSQVQVNNSGSTSNTVNMTAGDSLTATGGNTTVTDNSGGDVAATLSGAAVSIATVSGADGSVKTEDGSSTGITGGASSVVKVIGTTDLETAGAGDYFVVDGGSNTVKAAANNQIVVENTDGQFTDVWATNLNGQTTTVTGATDGITSYDDGNRTVNGPDQGTEINVHGSGNLVDGGAYDYLHVEGGGGNTVYANADQLVYVDQTAGTADTVNVNGDNNASQTSHGTGVGVYLNSNAQANVMGNEDCVNGTSGDNENIYGGGDLLVAGSSTLVDFVTNGDSTQDVVDASSDKKDQTTSAGSAAGIDIDASANVMVNGTGDTVQVLGNSAKLVTSANSGDEILIPQEESGLTITASNVSIELGASDHVSVTGSNDTITGGAGDNITVTGASDAIYDNNGSISFDGNYSGDTWYGTGDSDSGGTDGGVDPYGGDGSGFYGSYGFASKAAASNTSVAQVASYDAAQHDQAAAVEAQTAKLAAAAAVNSSTRSSAPLKLGATWGTKTVTWSLAQGAANPGTAFSGAIDPQYQAMLTQAFAAWSKASGITFQQVSDSAQSDIRIGWGDLGTSSGGAVGYTHYAAVNGAIQANATITLEDPNETALTTDSSGQLAYAGTDAELYQTMLHEIGHALGLGESSDPTSIMSSVLNDQNRTLSGSDIAAIHALYAGSSAGPAGLGASIPGLDRASLESQAAQLVQAMSSFTTGSTGVPTKPPPTMAEAANALALAAVHG